MAGLESLLRGRELAGRYRIEEVIGRGGMGAVYRATDLRLGRDVAVKVITASAGNDPQVRERLRARFRHEAASAARLPHHPNVVPVYDYGTDDELGLDYLVMELLRGEDLASRLQSGGPPPMGTALRILQHAARGVAVGHRSGLIHRDVKPGNVFLVREEDGAGGMQVRVLDFGIAKAMAEEDTTSGLTHDGRAPLSPAYASPEQLRGDARLTPASDVFSLGALGFQLLTGTRPFTEPDRNRMAAGMDVPAPALRARNAQVPEEVDEIIRRALAADPAERFPSAGAMADALEAPLRALGETPAASYIPAPLAAPPAEDDRTVAAGDDRTAFEEDDRTMLAPSPRGARPPPDTQRGPGPVITPPRRRQVAQESRGVPGLVWVVLLVAVLGLGGFLAWQQMGGSGADRVVAADTAAVDTAGDDTLTADDALMLSIEATRMLRQADYDSALALVERALTVDPRNTEYLDQRAVALTGLGRYEEASDVLVDITRSDPYYDLAYSHLAEARLAMGDTLSAMQALRRFIEITQDPRDRARAMQWLQRITPPPAPIQPVPGPTDTTPFVPGPSIDPAAPARETPATRPAPRDSIRLPG